MNSPIFSWPNAADVLKGAVVAGLTAIFTAIYNIITSVTPHFPSGWREWQPILIAGAAGFGGYLMKNFFSNSAGQLAQPETTPAAKAIQATKLAPVDTTPPLPYTPPDASKN